MLTQRLLATHSAIARRRQSLAVLLAASEPRKREPLAAVEDEQLVIASVAGILAVPAVRRRAGMASR
jgi:hypothetical protein